MDAFAPPSIRAESPRSGPLRVAGDALLTLVLGVSLFGVPLPPDATLDGSWQAMLVYAHAHGLQFGRDLIFTWGPWGFLCSLYHLGSAEAVPMLVWQTAGQFLVALSLVVLTRRLALWRRLAFAALFLCFHWLFLDSVYFVLIALIVISGMMRKDAPLVRLVAWALVLGFLAQLKFTYLVLATAGTASAAACWAGRGAWGRTWGIAGGFALAVVAAWIAAGQSPDNLYPYLLRSLEIASGYGDAMSTDESWSAFLWGSGLVLVCVAFVWTAWRRVPERAFATSACAYLAFSLLVMWKESFTRADLVPLGGHVFGFFTYVLILAPVIAGLLYPGRRWHWFDATIVLCLAAVACFDRPYYSLGPRIEWQRLHGNAAALGRLGSLPQEWQGAYEGACEKESLPRIRAAVGRSTVDVYDFSTGAALLNRLNLDPRPIFQSYSAYTPSLEGWNLRSYQSGRAPDFLLWNDERVDNRYPGQDDAMLLAALSGHYEPVFPERGYWLFKRVSPVARAQVERRLLLNRGVRLSEEIELPLERDHAIWLTADPIPNNLGRLRALLYKPAAISISTADDMGRRRVWRLLPRVARAGFILVPTLESGGDMASFLRGEADSFVDSFHFEAPPGQEEFWSRVNVAVFALPGIPLRPARPFQRLVELGIFDRPPVSITSVFRHEVIETPEGPAVLVHAEGEVVLGVPAGASRLAGDFGIREGAYTGGGHTAGVRFEVYAAWDSGRRERLWGRFLNPVGQLSDRGTQHFDLAIPGDAPDRLILRTGPGLADDNRWDWSYVASLRFDAPSKP
jgi:hypothetical protein